MQISVLIVKLKTRIIQSDDYSKMGLNSFEICTNIYYKYNCMYCPKIQELYNVISENGLSQIE